MMKPTAGFNVGVLSHFVRRELEFEMERLLESFAAGGFSAKLLILSQLATNRFLFVRP
jgi:hypothetical protein